MSFNQDPFMFYFQPLDSIEPVPRVSPEDLKDFEANLQAREMAAIDNISGTASELSVQALVKLMATHPLWLRGEDLAGPNVDISVTPPVQLSGLSIYRFRDSSSRASTSE